MSFLRVLAAGLLLVMAVPAVAGAMISARAEECIQGASAYHSVNSDILRAIVRHESRGHANTVARNTNGSIDVGLVGTNSVHFDELIKKGIAPAYLLDECVSVYWGAWNYSKKVYKYGNSWMAVGAYHSETPYFSARYQALIYNEMVVMGVLAGPQLLVPPLPRR